MIFGRIAVGGVGIGQLRRLVCYARKLPVLHEVQLGPPGLGTVFRALLGLQNAAGKGSRQSRWFAQLGFGETRAVAGVEGESLALIVGQAEARWQASSVVSKIDAIFTRHIGISLFAIMNFYF